MGGKWLVQMSSLAPKHGCWSDLQRVVIEQTNRWLRLHTKWLVIFSTICTDGPCNGDSDKCCCGDHLLSRDYRKRERVTVCLSNSVSSSHVPPKLLMISISALLPIYAWLWGSEKAWHLVATFKKIVLFRQTVWIVCFEIIIRCLINAFKRPDISYLQRFMGH